MSTKGLREAYKKLIEMYEEDEPLIEFDEDDVTADDDLFDEPYEFEKSYDSLQVILNEAKKHSSNPSEQVEFAINAIAADRGEDGKREVLVDETTIIDVLNLHDVENSKLSKILDENLILEPVGYEDIDTNMLGMLFKGAGKTLDELPEAMLTDSWFMSQYIESSVSENRDEFLNGRFFESPMTYGEIIEKVEKLCEEEKNMSNDMPGPDGSNDTSLKAQEKKLSAAEAEVERLTGVLKDLNPGRGPVQ